MHSAEPARNQGSRLEEDLGKKRPWQENDLQSQIHEFGGSPESRQSPNKMTAPSSAGRSQDFLEDHIQGHANNNNDATDDSSGARRGAAAFPVEDIVQHPLPGYVAPSAIAFSPDDQLVSYLFSPEGTLSRKLFVFDPRTARQSLLVNPPGGGVEEGNISTAEKLRRERLRERGLGVTRYDWSKSAAFSRLLVPLPDGVHVQDGPGASLRLRVPSSSSLPVLDPQISPDGSTIAYVADSEIWVVDASRGEPRQITSGAKEAGRTHGLAEYIAQEEMERRNGFWWSPDSRSLAFTEVDASSIPPFRILHQGKPQAVGADTEEDHAYPFAGHANVTVRLGVVRVARSAAGGGSGLVGRDAVSSAMEAWGLGSTLGGGGGTMELGEVEEEEIREEQEEGHVVWMDLCCGGGGRRKGGGMSPQGDAEDEEYLARVMWLPDGSLTAQVQSRDQTRLKLLRFDPRTGARQVVLQETNALWVNLHDCFTPLQKGGSAVAGEGDCSMHSALQHGAPSGPPDAASSPPFSLPLSVCGGFVWASERSGFRHLYLYDSFGSCLGPLTAGDWMVEQIAGVDENAGLIYYTGTADGPLETHLYCTPLAPYPIAAAVKNGAAVGAASSPSKSSRSNAAVTREAQEPVVLPASAVSQQNSAADSSSSPHRLHLSSSPSRPSPSPSSPSTIHVYRPRRLTHAAGRHIVVLDHQLQRFVDVHDALGQPPQVHLCSLLDGQVLMKIFEQPGSSPRLRRLPLEPPEIVSLQNPEGVKLYGAIYRPDPSLHGPPPYRTVVSVYGGPHVQTVCDSWMSTVDMRAQYLRNRGILVWKLDNRGSSRRGLPFEGPIKFRMGSVDVDDQATGVAWLVAQGLADPSRVGIYGWSYGGYIAAMALCRCPSTFRCAVAGAPVTAWDGYDTHYTERYMGHPDQEKAAYESSSVMAHVGGMAGRLLLVHGMIDENVHFRHSARLINALTAAAKEYELLLFPDERHMPRGVRDRMYMEERIFEFLDRNLQQGLQQAPRREQR